MRPPLDLAYQRLRDGARGPSLYGLTGPEKWTFEPAGVWAAFGERPRDGATSLRGITLLPEKWGSQRSVQSSGGGLATSLATVCRDVLPGRVALALSGGLDSAVLLALLREKVTAYTFAPTLPGYDESDRALATARGLGVPVQLVTAGAEELVEALPNVVRYAETPLYNLHPVARWLLARRVRADGFDRLVTGDGANQLLAGVSGVDHLPIAGALTRGAGLAIDAPFLDPGLAHLRGRDPTKRELRRLALELGLPRALVEGPKRPGWAPALDLDRHWRADRLRDISAELGRPISRASDRERVGWTTLGLFSEVLDACAA